METKLFKNNKNDRHKLFTMLYSLDENSEFEIVKNSGEMVKQKIKYIMFIAYLLMG